MGDEPSNRGCGEAPPRPPTLTDLARICGEFNRLGARYVVVGGLAVIQAGYSRTTEVIDLLVETTPENEARIIQGLLILPDQTARAKDIPDRLYLRQLLDAQSVKLDPDEPVPAQDLLTRSWERLKAWWRGSRAPPFD